MAAAKAAGHYASYLHGETLRVVSPYLILGCLALVWAIMIGFMRLPAFLEAREHAAEVSGDWHDLLGKPHFLLAVVAQFAYVGASVCTWSYFIQYCKEYAYTSERLGGILLACTMGLFTIGRFVSTGLIRRYSPSRIMMFYALVNATLLMTGILLSNRIGLSAIFLTSLFMSLMFPTIFALGIKDLGANTNIAGSFIVMATIGGALMPPVMGLLAEHFNSTALAYRVPLYGNLIVTLYSHFVRKYSGRKLTISTFEV